jgi:hypothetical protein
VESAGLQGTFPNAGADDDYAEIVLSRWPRTLILIGSLVVVLIAGWRLFYGEPSAESEVEKYLRIHNLDDTVTVRDCGWSDPGSGNSQRDLYWCDLHARAATKLPDSNEPVPLDAGASRVCFWVPRSDRAWGSSDYDAQPVMLLGTDRTCFGGHS